MLFRSGQVTMPLPLPRYLHLAEPAELTEPTELVCYVPMDIVRVTLPSLTLIDNLGIPLCFVKLSLIGYLFFFETVYHSLTFFWPWAFSNFTLPKN